MFTVEILEHPGDHFVLENTTVVIHCKTVGVQASWLLNKEVISAHTNTMSKYANQGFMFTSAVNQNEGYYYNLTLTVLASKKINNTRIQCRARSSNHVHLAYSKVAHLIVFSSFRKSALFILLLLLFILIWFYTLIGPNPPHINVYFDLLYDSMSTYIQPLMSITLTAGEPLWPEYTISAFKTVIINISNYVVLKEINIPVDSLDSTIQFNQSLPYTVTDNDCFPVMLIATALSERYGPSKPSVMGVFIPRCKFT